VESGNLAGAWYADDRAPIDRTAMEVRRRKGQQSVFIQIILVGILLAGTPAADDGSEHTGGEQVPAGKNFQMKLDAALAKARIWLDGLTVDAVELQANGVNGKKKVAEILAAYRYFYVREVDPFGKEVILRRVREIASQTRLPEWHNLLTCGDTEFVQNGMSYFRVLRLMDDFGLDTAAYRAELIKVKPRFDGHFAARGAWQRAVFAGYYDRFGLERPAILDGAADEKGVIAKRLPDNRYSVIQAYQLTHQVFASFDYGNSRTQERLTKDDLSYLTSVLPALVDRAIDVQNPDLLSELLSCMAYLGLREHPAWSKGIDTLLASQNPDGTWGNYTQVAYGPFVEQKVTLHTTGVAIHALVTVRTD
jgi:hypothetical protein